MPQLTLKDGDSLYYEVHGAGPPLLLVAGLGGVGTFWKDHVPAFAERFRVVLHDHRGTGQSSPSQIDYSVGQMAGDLLQLMDHLDIGRADLIGHSTGGAIGQTLALDQPDRIGKLVLSAPVLFHCHFSMAGPQRSTWRPSSSTIPAPLHKGAGSKVKLNTK